MTLEIEVEEAEKEVEPGGTDLMFVGCSSHVGVQLLVWIDVPKSR